MSSARAGTGLPGALVLSLDFELAWGLRDQIRHPDEARERLLGARQAVPRLLELFEEFQVSATWATVGFLFAATREELRRFAPSLEPEYRDPRLSPYQEPLGDSEQDDPFHYAASLVRAIQRTPLQEIASHTYSHYYCTEAGQNKDTFRADIASACAIAAYHGVRLRSIVFPRNQHNRAYDDVLLENGFRTYRGNPLSRSWRFSDFEGSLGRWKRVGRLSEAYLGGGRSNTTDWADLRSASGLSDVRASGMLRPYQPALRHLEPLRLQRIRRSLHTAAEQGRILHLWWHPHNFGVHQEENLAFLRRMLLEFAEVRGRFGMQSLSMAGADAFLNWEGERGGMRPPSTNGNRAPALARTAT
jgi:peptidoglycan/xylan/chitin deacetylase (PgdA/CDA1 family)